MNDKVCPRCGEAKPLAEFYRRTCAKDGLDYRCKQCDEQRRTARNGGPRQYRKGDPTPAEIAARAAAIRDENFEREMAGEVLGEHGNAAWRVEREPRVYFQHVFTQNDGPLYHLARTTARERMDWVRVP